MIVSTLVFAALSLQGAPVAPCSPPPRGNKPWVTDADYPQEARRQRMQGDVTFTLDVSSGGCPTRCVVVKSSGHPLLDEQTCALMMERARFKPKLDAEGRPTETTWTNKFHWGL